MPLNIVGAVGGDGNGLSAVATSFLFFNGVLISFSGYCFIGIVSSFDDSSTCIVNGALRN